jgi:metallo-beta-lactamase class B
MRKLLFALTLFSTAAFAQPAGWLEPLPPHKVMDNLYFVGTKELATFLITTPQGHILMNSNYEASVPVIRKSVEQLGFKFTDIKILIAGHAHPDHVEGDALVKELTGAQVVVGRLEVEGVNAIRIPSGKGHPMDRLLDEGDTVSLGGTTLTAHVLPGHTRGCLAWTLDLTEGGKTYKGFIECSLNGQFLTALTQYPGITEDFRSTYKKALTFAPDVWVSSHASFYGLPEKLAKLQARKEGDPNPFIDPQGYLAHVAEFSASFEKALAAPPANNAKGKGKGKQ